jgi:murein tripeptide amidase MpaA
MMQGFLEFLCGPTPAAEYLRRRVVWKVVPMLNPDGVVAGNYRTGLSGKDFNREFLNPDRFVFPEIIALKELVSKCKQ